jgi:acyl carrier protein
MKDLEREILLTIGEYFRKNGIDFDNNRLESVSFLAEGWIDSFGLMDFILFLEDTFDISLTPEDLQSERFRIIRGVKEIILEKLLQKGKE